MKRNELYILAAVISAALVYFIWITAKIYPFQTADGSIYMEVAQNIAQGKGLFYLSDGRLEPYVFWPPLYPFLIGFFSKITGWDVLTVSSLLSGICLVVTFYLLYKIFKLFKLNLFLIASGLILYWLSWLFLLHFSTLSETLFIPLFLASYYYLLRWSKEYRTKHLVLSGFFIGLALLTRYAAWGIIGAYLIILFIASKDMRSAFKNAFLFLIPVAILFTPWYLYTLRYTGFFQREWGLHLVGSRHLYEMNVTFANWFTPGLTKIFIIPLFVLLLISMLLLIKKLPDLVTDKKIYIPVFIGGIYFVFILFSISFFDFDTPLDTRILAPVYFALLPAGLYYLQHVEFVSKKLFFLIISIVLFSHAINILPKSKELIIQSKQIKNLEKSALIQTVQRYQNRIIWSNVSDLLKYYVDNDTLIREFPVKYDRKTLKTNMEFTADMNRLKQQLDKEQGMIVYFFGFIDREFLPGLDDFNKYFDDYPTYRFNHGIIIFPKQFKDSLKVAGKP